MDRRNVESDLDGLLIAILMCYPEIVTIRYRRNHRKFRLLFALNRPLTKDEFRSFEHNVNSSLRLYQRLTGALAMKPTISMLNLLEYTGLEIELAVDALSREALSLVVGLVQESFNGHLMRDVEEELSAEEKEYQEELIEYMLEDVRNNGYTKDVIGMRDNGRVAIYDQ